jgi:hypothetical protein
MTGFLATTDATNARAATSVAEDADSGYALETKLTPSERGPRSTADHAGLIRRHRPEPPGR